MFMHMYGNNPRKRGHQFEREWGETWEGLEEWDMAGARERKLGRG